MSLAAAEARRQQPKVTLCPLGRARAGMSDADQEILDRWLAEGVPHRWVAQALAEDGVVDPATGKPINQRRLTDHKRGDCACR